MNNPPLSLSHQRGMLALYSASVIIAINGVFSKVIPLDAITITFTRCVIAFIAMCIILQLQNTQSLFRLRNKSSYLKIVAIGALMSVHWSSFFHAMQTSTVAIGILAHYSFPIMTVLLESLLNKQRPAIKDVISGLIVLVGVAIMVPSWNLDSQVLIGVGFGLLSAAAWSTRNVLQGRWLANESGQSIMTYQLLLVAIFTTLLCDFSALSQVSNTTWITLLLLGVVSTAFGHTLFAIALRVINAKSVSLISCLQPPIAIGLSWLIIAEVPTLETLIGGSIILCVALYEAINAKPKHT